MLVALPDAQTPLRFGRCSVCGQEYDTTDLDQVFHHGGEPHEPLPTGAPSPADP